jgi:UDP-glucose 4-epimerase
LCQRLLDDPRCERVAGIDCFTDYYPRAQKEANLAPLRDRPNFDFVEADLLTADLGMLLDASDGVFHQAAQAGVRASWGDSFDIYTNNNVLATQRLLEACRAHRGDIRVVYASSSSIYGETRQLPMTEDAIPAPVSPYGVSKLAGEHLCRLYWRNFQVPTVALRYFTVYGPGQRPDMAFHRFIRAAFLGDTIEIYGDGEQSRDFTFIADAVEANVAAMTQGEPGAVYNIGGGSRATVNEVLDLLRDITGRELKVDYKGRASGDVTHTSADVSRAKEQLGFAPKVSLQEGLRREVEWFEREVLPNLKASSAL